MPGASERQQEWVDRLSRPRHVPASFGDEGGTLLDKMMEYDDGVPPGAPQAKAMELLKLLKQAFLDADEDGDGSMDEREFQMIREVLRQQLGDSLTPNQLSHLFLKIDVDCDGGLAWHEVSTALLLRAEDRKDDKEGGGVGAMEMEVVQELRPTVPPPSEAPSAARLQYIHRAPITNIARHGPTGVIYSSSMDGSVRVWEPNRLKHIEPESGNPYQTIRLKAKDMQSSANVDVRKRLIFEGWSKQPRAPEAPGNPIPVTSIDFVGADEKWLVVLGMDKTVGFYSVATMQRIALLGEGTQSGAGKVR